MEHTISPREGWIGFMQTADDKIQNYQLTLTDYKEFGANSSTTNLVWRLFDNGRLAFDKDWPNPLVGTCCGGNSSYETKLFDSLA